MKRSLACVTALIVTMVLACSTQAGLLGYYSFDGDFTDGSGNNNHLTLATGAPTITNTTGEYMFGGGALDADSTVSTQEWLNLTNPILFSNADTWSVAFWARRRPGTDDRSGMVIGDPSNTRDFIWLSNNPSQVQGLRFRSSSNANGNFGTFPDDNQFHHWVVIADGAGNVTSYRDNTLQPAKSMNSSFSITSVAHAYSQSTQSMDGQIDELYIYDEAIDAAAVAALYGGGPSTGSCDFEPDGDCDIDDIDALTLVGDLSAGVAVPPADAKFDLNADNVVDGTDYSVWLSSAATENGHASAYRPADSDLDRDVDITDFNTLAANFDPGASNAGNRFSLGDSDGDDDIDIADFNRLASSFSPGGYDGAVAAVAADADPGEVDLVVDIATGEVVLDGNAAAISGLQVFSAGNSLLATDFTADVLQFVISTNASTYAEGAFIDTAVNGQVSLGILYDLLVDARDLTFEYTMIGQPTAQGTVIYVPEPASMVLLGLGGVVLFRRRS